MLFGIIEVDTVSLKHQDIRSVYCLPHWKLYLIIIITVGYHIRRRPDLGFQIDFEENSPVVVMGQAATRVHPGSVMWKGLSPGFIITIWCWIYFLETLKFMHVWNHFPASNWSSSSKSVFVEDDLDTGLANEKRLYSNTRSSMLTVNTGKWFKNAPPPPPPHTHTHTTHYIINTNIWNKNNCAREVIIWSFTCFVTYHRKQLKNARPDVLSLVCYLLMWWLKSLN